MTHATIFNNTNWFLAKYDGRNKQFRGISRDEFNKAVAKHNSRGWRASDEEDLIAKAAWRKEMISTFAAIPFEYQGEGLDDYNFYQRPSSNGVGYVALCPGERGNNIYVEDELLVNYLTAKFNESK